MTSVPRRKSALVALALCAFAACGKKGPPLPPLHLVPEPVADVSARRAGDEVRLRFTLPVKNQNGPGPVNLDRVEVFAATIAEGAAAPPNREFLTSKFVAGTIPVRRVAEGEAAETTVPADTRPAPGEPALFLEQLTEDKLRPQFTKVDPSPAPAAPGAAGPPAAQAPSPYRRIYAIRGVARNGRPGQASTRIEIPLVAPPPAPSNIGVAFTASGLQVSWLPPVAAEGAAPVAGYNVYARDAALPLNEKPLAATTFERSGVEFGKEECFVVRSVLTFRSSTIESAPSTPQCLTPADIFPPAEPAGLRAVAAAGAVNLIWEANTEPDLAGYLVLRGEAPGEKLQAVTPTPISETTYRDTTVKPGVRYVYAIVAVDRATPPNVSGQSGRVEETAR